MSNFRFIFDAFDSAAALAREAGEKEVTVRKWRARDSVPPTKWDAIVTLARKKRLKGVTFDRLREAYASRWNGAAQ